MIVLKYVLLVLLCFTQITEAKIRRKFVRDIGWEIVNRNVCGELELTASYNERLQLVKIVMIIKGEVMVRAFLKTDDAMYKMMVKHEGRMVPYPHMDEIRTFKELNHYMTVIATQLGYVGDSKSC